MSVRLDPISRGSTAVQETPRGRGPERDDDAPASDVAGATFEALLRLPRLPADLRTAAVNKTIAPERMFEETPEGSSRDRITNLKEEDRTRRLDAGGGGRYDRTSIDARRGDVAQPGGRSNESRFAAEIPSSTPLEGRASAMHERAGGAERPGEIPSAGSDGRGASAARVNMNSPDTTVTAGANSQNARSGALQASTSPGGDRAVTPATGRAVGSPGVAGKPGGDARSPASAVGRFLAGSQAAESESGRGVTQGPPTGESRLGRDGGDMRGQGATSRQEAGARTETRATETRESTFENLVRSIRLRAATNRSSARLQLDPPELGRLDVDVRVDGDRIEIDVRTETETARRLVQRRVAELVTAMERHGVSVDHVDVRTGAFGGLSAEQSVLTNPDGGSSRGGSGGTGDGGRVSSGAEEVSEETHASAALPAGAVASETRLDIRV